MLTFHYWLNILHFDDDSCNLQVLLLHKASQGSSFSQVFDFEATDLDGDDLDERTR